MNGILMIVRKEYAPWDSRPITWRDGSYKPTGRVKYTVYSNRTDLAIEMQKEMTTTTGHLWWKKTTTGLIKKWIGEAHLEFYERPEEVIVNCKGAQA